MQYLIYHNKDFLRYSAGQLTNDTVFPRIDARRLNLVAKVNATSLNHAFYFTNHIDKSWWRNQAIVWWRPARSTSVGDVIFDMDSKLYYVVAPFGFKPIYRLAFFHLEKD